MVFSLYYCLTKAKLIWNWRAHLIWRICHICIFFISYFWRRFFLAISQVLQTYLYSRENSLNRPDPFFSTNPVFSVCLQSSVRINKISSHKRPLSSCADLKKTTTNKQNKKNPPHVLLEKSFSFLSGKLGWIKAALGCPRSWVRHCNQGTSLVVVLVVFVMLKMLPQSHGKRAARGCAVHTDTCYTDRLN